MKYLILVIGLAGLTGCKEENGVKIAIHPKNNISKDCFVKAVTSANKDIIFKDEKVDGNQTLLNFKMSEAFEKKLQDLKILNSEKFQTQIESWFKSEDQKLKEIKFSILFDDSKVEKLSEQDKARLLTFMRPHALGIRMLPDRLYSICSLQADLKTEIEVHCTQDLCTTPAPASAEIDCYDSDKVPAWEKAYQAAAGETLFEKYKTDSSVPSGRCQRIKWLKTKTCPLMKSSTEACLTTKDFLKN